MGPKTQNDNFLEFWLNFKTSCRPCPEIITRIRAKVFMTFINSYYLIMCLISYTTLYSPRSRNLQSQHACTLP
jgi:hypothetical protein